MTDVTFQVYDQYIKEISKFPNKKHWKARNLSKRVNEHIGGLRIEAFRRRGTFAGFFCSSEATRLEKKLSEAMLSRWI